MPFAGVLVRGELLRRLVRTYAPTFDGDALLSGARNSIYSEAYQNNTK